MKKRLIFLLLLFCPLLAMYSQNLGDVNEDGTISIMDALLVAQHYVGLDPVNFTASLSTGDVNIDNTINIVDALLISQYYVGALTELPPPGTPTLDPTTPPVSTNNPGDCLPCEEATPLPDSTATSTYGPLPAGTPAPIVPPRAGLFTVTTSTGTIRVCSTFTTKVTLNTDTYVATSYQVTFTYDYPTIKLLDCVDDTGVTVGADGFVSNIDNSNPGTLIISGYDSAGTGPGTSLDMFTVNWKAFPFDTTEYNDYKQTFVYMAVDSLLDDSGETLGDPGVDRRYDLVVYTGNIVPPDPW